MDSKACVVFLLALVVGVALALATAGSTEAAAAGEGRRRRPYGARQQLLMAPVTATSAALGVEARRRVLSSISSSSLDPNRAACIGSCPAPGGAYTGRGCKQAYQCRGG